MQKSNTETFTANEQLAMLFAASVAVQLTVVVPSGKHVPGGGTHIVVTPEQLSLATGAVKVTAAQVWPGEAAALMFAGQAIVGACVSVTVTVNEQLGPAVVVQFTVVVPTGKNEPEAGAQLTVPQSSVVAGAG